MKKLIIIIIIIVWGLLIFDNARAEESLAFSCVEIKVKGTKRGYRGESLIAYRCENSEVICYVNRPYEAGELVCRFKDK